MERPPASVEKLYTATTALEEMGASARLATTVYGVGNMAPCDVAAVIEDECQRQQSALLAWMDGDVDDRDIGARGATTRFAQHGIGDVHLTWENEALREVAANRTNLNSFIPR